MKPVRRDLLLRRSRVALATAASAHAQYPAKPMRLIVPFPPGGGTDTLARIYGQKLGELLGPAGDHRQPPRRRHQHRRGDRREIAARRLHARSWATSRTRSTSRSTASSATTSSAISRRSSLLASTPNILVVHPSIPAKSVKELIALAQARPGQLDYASSGSGTSSHLAAELFSIMAGVKMTHIPYKGGGPSVIALDRRAGVGRLRDHAFGDRPHQDRARCAGSR